MLFRIGHTTGKGDEPAREVRFSYAQAGEAYGIAELLAVTHDVVDAVCDKLLVRRIGDHAKIGHQLLGPGDIVEIERVLLDLSGVVGLAEVDEREPGYNDERSRQEPNEFGAPGRGLGPLLGGPPLLDAFGELFP